MICNLLRVTESELEEYLQDSSLLEANIYEEESEDGNPKLVDIDKAWDGIIFLLTGYGIADANHPLVQVLFSEQIVDKDQDLGYGSAHYLTPVQVADLNSQIVSITTEELKSRYNPRKMTELELYPTIWAEEGDEDFNYLKHHFATVQRVYAEATRNGEAIITFIN